MLFLCKKNKNSFKEQGFTLTEMAVVLSVIGLVLGLSLTIGMARVDSIKVNTTKNRLNFIAEALEHYIRMYGYLPCPADATKHSLHDRYGVGLGSGNGVVAAAVNCQSENFTVAGNNVVSGMVPAETLKIEGEIAFDGWGRKITYVVDEDLTNRDGYQNNTSDITILDDVAGNVITNNAMFVVLSHGENGHGAWIRKASSTRRDTGVADGTAEGENSHIDAPAGYDAVFVQRPHSADYDDILQYRVRWQVDD